MARPPSSRPEPRASWKGELVLDLLRIPVSAYNVASRRENAVHFHQLHAACHSRIRHEKICPIHGEVAAQEIVSGYEFAPDHYVEVHSEEIAKLRSSGEQLLTLESFVHPQAIDPIYYDGRAYYLVPDTDEAVESYAVLHAAMRNQERYGIGEIVFSGREQLIALRPLDGLLAMQMLSYQYQLRSPEMFQQRSSDRVDEAPPPCEELAIAEELVEALADESFDIDDYEDVYETKLRSLVQAKLAGEEIVASPLAEQQPRVINFRDALRRSVDRAHAGPPRPVGRPAGRRSGSR